INIMNGRPLPDTDAIDRDAHPSAAAAGRDGPPVLDVRGVAGRGGGAGPDVVPRGRVAADGHRGGRVDGGDARARAARRPRAAGEGGVMPSPHAPKLPPLQVATDHPCATCGYNLRTMPLDGRCP